jgi:hypothetical protein
VAQQVMGGKGDARVAFHRRGAQSVPRRARQTASVLALSSIGARWLHEALSASGHSGYAPPTDPYGYGQNDNSKPVPTAGASSVIGSSSLCALTGL